MYKYMYSACIAWNSTYCLETQTKNKNKIFIVWSICSIIRQYLIFLLGAHFTFYFFSKQMLHCKIKTNFICTLHRSVTLHFWLIMCNRNIIITWLRSLYDRAWDLLAFRNDAILKITNKIVFVYHVTRVVKPVNSEEIRMDQTGS